MKKLGVFLSLAMLTVCFTATSAFAAADASAVSTVTSGALTLKDTITEVLTTVLPYAAALVAIAVGWRVARRFVRA